MELQDFSVANFVDNAMHVCARISQKERCLRWRRSSGFERNAVRRGAKGGSDVVIIERNCLMLENLDINIKNAERSFMTKALS